MTNSNRNSEQVGLILRTLRQCLGPYILRTYKAIYSEHYLREIEDVWRSSSHNPPHLVGEKHALDELDLHACLKLMRNRWNEAFHHLGSERRAWVSELVDTRNRYAHETEAKAFSESEMRRVAKVACQVLEAIGARDEAEEVKLIPDRLPSVEEDKGPVSTALPLGVPVVQANVTETSIRLTWGAVPGAGQYTVNRRPAGATVFGEPVTMTVLGCIIRKLASATKYRMRVRAEPQIGDNLHVPGKWSSFYVTTLASRPVPLEVPKVEAIPGEAGISLTWNRVPDAAGYEVRYRRVGASRYSNAISVTNLVYTCAGRIPRLVPATAYSVQVRAMPTSGDARREPGEWHSLSVITTAPRTMPLDIPTGRAKMTESSITLLWDDVPRASHYEVRFRQTGTSRYSVVTNVTTLYHIIKRLAAATTYAVQLRAMPASDDRHYEPGPWHSLSVTTLSPQSAERPAGPSSPMRKAPHTPVGVPALQRQVTTAGARGTPVLQGAVTAEGVSLCWSPVAGAIQYELQYRTPGSSTYTQTKTDAQTRSRVLHRMRIVDVRVRALFVQKAKHPQPGDWSAWLKSGRN